MIFKIRSIATLSCFNGRRIIFPALSATSGQKRYKSLSYSHVIGDVPLLNETIGNLIDKAPEAFGDRLSIVDCHQGIRKTFIQHVAEINQFAAGLMALNFKLGDRIGIWSPNRYEWTVAAHAAAKAGLILVPLNPAYQAPELQHCIEKLNMRAVIAYDNFKTQNYYEIINKVIPEISQTKTATKVKSQKYPYFDTLIMMTDKELPGAIRFEDVYQAATSESKFQLEKIQPKIDPKSPAVIMFTSGTTGKPKAAMASHFSAVNSAPQRRKRFLQDTSKEFRLCCPPPLFHIFGYDTIVGAYDHGNTVVLPSMIISPAESIKAIDKEKCHSLLGTATMFMDIINHPDCKNADFSSLYQILMSGSLCPAPLLAKIKEEWKCIYISTAYGTTETFGAVTATNLDKPWQQVLSNCGSTGDNVEIKIIDGDGNVVPRGSRGEICARGYGVMIGYWGEDDTTKAVLSDDGWYKTGDVGIMTEDGFLQVVDRIKDMIIRGGENIYPKEIEDLLAEHPKIAEVYVFGVPDERLNEEVCTWIRCKTNQTLTESDIRTFCEGKLAHFKIPKYIRFVDNFPRTLSGKVQKFVMKEEHVKQMKSK
ncbi:hypothetical protein CHUAL_013182 [Chamberlinius hualienensis]